MKINEDYLKGWLEHKVVFNPQKPTTHDVDWNGQQWFFPERPDFGGYGRDGCPFVRKLKQGI